MFNLTAPLEPGFHPTVCVQGFVSTLFFGWLAVYLPSVLPVEVRAAGSGLAYNAGRFVTAAGVLAAGSLFTALGGDYVLVGSVCSLVYALGVVAIWLTSTTDGTAGRTPQKIARVSDFRQESRALQRVDALRRYR